jgi:hypothetical protein
MGDRGDFEKMLDEYKSNYVQFLTTGNKAYQTAYKNAQDAVEKMVSARQGEVQSQKNDMLKFTQSFKDGNDEMGQEYEKAAELRSNAQKIEDDYNGAKNRYDLYKLETPTLPRVDVPNGYAIMLRFGIVLFLLPLLFLIGVWSPQLNPFSTSFMRPSSPFEMNITSPALGSVR